MTNIKEYRTRQVEQGELWEELKVEHHWFHIVRGMIYRGMLREMTPMGWSVYCVLKAHTNFESGEARPSIQRIAELIGVSHDTIQRAMKRLEELDLVMIERKGKVNGYKLKEQMAMTTRTGELFGMAEKNYAPNSFSEFVEQLKAFAKTGNVPDSGKGITINVTLNIQNINQGNGGTVTMNVQQIQTPGLSKDALENLQKRVSKLKLIE